MKLRPKFRIDLMASEHTDSDGSLSIILKDPVSEKFYRLSPYELQFLRTFDGTRTLEDAVEKFRTSGHYCSLKHGEAILAKAAQLGLVLGTSFGTAQFQARLRDRAEQNKRVSRFTSAYFLFIPLVNPDKFLQKTLWLYKAVATRQTGWLAALSVPGALYLILSSLPSMERGYSYFFNWQNLLYLWITIAVTKLIHELAHAYTAKSFGLRVPQMGVAFLIFFPCLFCNTTDAWQLADRRQRMAISAAGIVAEGVLATICTYVWHFTQPGIVNSLALYLMAVSFVSTVLFNGNPLMKFDGYFILIDYLNIPNLFAKSFAYLRYLFMNGVLGIGSIPNPAETSRQSSIFAVYGICSFAYRISLYTGIVAGVYLRFDKTIGVVLATLAFGLFILRPIIRGVRSLYRNYSEIHPRLSGVVVFSILLLGGSAILFTPLTTKSVYPCYVASKSVQKLSVPLQASVAKAFAKEGAAVKQREVLFALDSSLLELSLFKQEIRRAVLQRELDLIQLDAKNMGRAPAKQIEIYHADDEIGKTREELRIARSGIIAPFDGVITKLDYHMQPGFQPGEGALVGELQSLEDCCVHGLIPEEDRQKVRVGQTVEVWLPVTGGRVLRGQIQDIKPYNERDLKDSPFSSRFGGELATEIRGEQHRDSPLEAQYRCTVHFPAASSEMPLGMTGRLVVRWAPKSLVSRFMDTVSQVFRREFLM